MDVNQKMSFFCVKPQLSECITNATRPYEMALLQFCMLVGLSSSQCALSAVYESEFSVSCDVQ